ncbi:hypothetical protein Tco_0996233 [Tanacetum coccineum]
MGSFHAENIASRAFLNGYSMVLSKELNGLDENVLSIGEEHLNTGHVQSSVIAFVQPLKLIWPDSKECLEVKLSMSEDTQMTEETEAHVAIVPESDPAEVTYAERREGQDTQKELEKSDLKAELEEREWKHFSSKDKG